MSDNITKRVGLGTAYGFAKAGGYEGTVAEFTELLGNIAIDLARIENLSVTVTTLPAGSQATASLNGSVLSLGIPKGDKGDKGNTGETGAPAGFGTVSATVDTNIGTPSVEVTASGADTAKNFAFAFHNLKGQKGDKGDTGEVSEAELTQAFEDFSANGTVANAEQLTTDIRANDQTPYLFRTSGGSVDIGDREYINGIVGGTVAWNQLIPIRDYDVTTTEKGVTLTDNRDGTYTINGTATAKGSIQFVSASLLPTPTNHVFVMTGFKTVSGAYMGLGGIDIDRGSGGVWKNTSEYSSLTARIDFNSGTVFTNVKIVPQLFDLTLMFGSTIADYIYSLEQATAGAGVAFFKSLFPKPYYAYNAGELMSVKGLVSHDMVGFNQWDEEWELGSYGSDGLPVASTDKIRTKNRISVKPSTAYYFKNGGSGNLIIFWYDESDTVISFEGTNNAVKTSPTNAKYLRFRTNNYGNTYKHDICINLSWDGSRDGEYEPYQKWSYPLDSDLELRGIPKIENGNLYYDGDTYESDGTVTRKYGIVDLGSFPDSQYNYYEYTGGIDGFTITGIMDVAKKANSVNDVANIMMSGFVAVSDGTFNLDGKDKEVCLNTLGIVKVKYDGITTVSAFKTAMSGVYLVYELATPTTETADPYTNPQIVNDFGTEEFVISNTVAVPIPVGHNTDYPINLKAQVEMMPHSPDGDGDYIVRQTNGTNEYVALANNATIQNILSRLEALEG